MRNSSLPLWLSLVTGLWLATAALAGDEPPLPREPTDKIDVERHEDGLALAWSDAEDRLKGSILPNTPREGQPLRVSLQVGSFEGEDFNGPLILTLREAGANHGTSVTVARGEHNWEATFTPEHEGAYLLDVTFISTRHKSLHAAFDVAPSQVPRMLGWSVLGLGCLLLLGYTVRNLLKGDRAEERALPASPEGPVVPGETPPAPAPESAPAPAPAQPAEASATPSETPPAPTPTPTAAPEPAPAPPAEAPTAATSPAPAAAEVGADTEVPVTQAPSEPRQ